MPAPVCRHIGTAHPNSPTCFHCQHSAGHSPSRYPAHKSRYPRLVQGDFDSDDEVRHNHLPPSATSHHIPSDQELFMAPRELPRLQPRHRRPFCSFWLPAFFVTVPLLPIAFALLYIVVRYRVQISEPAFPDLVKTVPLPNIVYIYLKFSASRILFISGLAATMAPYLGSGIMALWIFQIGRRLLHDADTTTLDELPTPRQYGHLLSLAAASFQRLLQYMWHTRGNSGRVPSVLRRASLILGLTFLFAATIIINDVVLHYTTRSKLLRQAILPERIGNRSLRISDACLKLNRTDNSGMSCARNYILWMDDPEAYTAQQSDIINLSHNVSESATIHIEEGPLASEPGMAIVIPKREKIPSRQDFRASTLGAQTTCHLRTQECGFWLTGWQGINQWAFNCSESFFGVLGKQPRLATDPQDPDQPPLTYKPTNQLQLGYFTDPDLKILYNSQGANASGIMPDAPIALPNDNLINPVYVGIAARFPLGSMSADADFDTSPEFFNGTGGWYGFALSCTYTIFDVQYTWSNGSVLNFTSTPSPNGTFAEIYHGWHSPGQTNQLDLNLQDAMVQATMENNSTMLLKKWSELYSMQVMSVIGAMMISAPSIVEQEQNSMLVAQVAIPPLVIIASGCIGYAVFGLIVVISAFRATQADVSDFPSLLSVEGLALWAFKQHDGQACGVRAQSKNVWHNFGIDSNQDVQKSRTEVKIGIISRTFGHSMRVFEQTEEPSPAGVNRTFPPNGSKEYISQTPDSYPRAQSRDKNKAFWI